MDLLQISTQLGKMFYCLVMVEGVILKPVPWSDCFKLEWWDERTRCEALAVWSEEENLLKLPKLWENRVRNPYSFGN